MAACGNASARCYSRGEFLGLCAGALALMSAPRGSMGQGQSQATGKPMRGKDSAAGVFDLRDFVRWILEDFEPSVRLAGGAGRYAGLPGQTVPALYGIADMACVLYTIGALHPSTASRAEWGDAFALFQNSKTGWFLQKDSGLSEQHNTAFALGAMQLLELAPRFPVRTEPRYENIRAYLNTLDWHTGVYADSHKGAGIGSIYVLAPGLGSTRWFDEYFAVCDGLFDSHNGMMGREKPAGGDMDQIGGTFHYGFLYEFFNRRMPYPEQRIDAVLRLQQPDGYWSPTNHLWMTLDAIYLMTRSLRYCQHRYEDVRASVRRALRAVQQDTWSPEGRKAVFAKGLAVHSLTASTAIAAEAQQFLGAQEVLTDWPLKLVLDRRPFI